MRLIRWSFLLSSFLLGQASGAVTYVFGDPSQETPDAPIVLTGTTGRDIDLNNDGRDDVRVSLANNNQGLSNYRLEPKAGADLQVAGSPTSLKGFAAILNGSNPVATAQRLEDELGLSPLLDYQTANSHYLASSSDLATESDGQWSNQASSRSVSGVVALKFINQNPSDPATLLGFITLEVNESTQTISIASYGFEEIDAGAIPEPSSSLLILASGFVFLLRRRT